ncbi:hypothetical protein DV515_00019750 [Chloebia gouldiae]|uniref:Uncharacterized protein n=1 Tax=Chloebia gouldiae TaxID=44316 RepID=A0A3L8Q4H1_CHLGU|nr:hypothetical protein DV515_00019750 [Chloebia gouldiae]
MGELGGTGGSPESTKGVTLAVEVAELQATVEAAAARYRQLLRQKRHPAGDSGDSQSPTGTPGDSKDTEGDTVTPVTTSDTEDSSTCLWVTLRTLQVTPSPSHD